MRTEPLKAQKSILADKGQVTIPKVIRDRLGLKSGTVLRFAVDHNKIVVTKEVTSDPIESVRGCLPYLGSVDKLIDELRGPK